ncbi:hypothetical protein T440DRAFT_396867, partial [Plenodomus tracheiphilus IPT5]
CDGQRPLCQTCREGSHECVWDVPIGITRQQLGKRKALELEKSSTSLRNVLDLLLYGNEADALAALRRIRHNEDVDDAVNEIQVAQTLLDTSTSTVGIGISSTILPGRPSSPETFRPPKRMITSPDCRIEKDFLYAQDQCVEKDVCVDVPNLKLDIAKWTNACSDNSSMNHLLNLFWTWDNGTERTFHRPMFEEDLSTCEPSQSDMGQHAFCSPFLVNATLALACLFTTNTTAFTMSEDPKTRGRQFAEEAERHYAREKLLPSIPLLQGQFAMFCYEGCLDSGTKSIGYYSGMIQTYKLLNNHEILAARDADKSKERIRREREALSWVMWGTYCTEWRATIALGFRKQTSKPLIDKLWRSSESSPSTPGSADRWSSPYSMSVEKQMSMEIKVREADCHLSAIVEDVLDFVIPNTNAGSKPPTTDPQRAIYLYNELMTWKLSLPEGLRTEDASTPSTVLLHCDVEIATIALLRPFSNLEKSDFGPFNPRDRCYSHACSLAYAIWTFRSVAYLRFEYWLTYALSTVAFITLDNCHQNPPQIEALLKACQCLHETTSTLPLAADVLSAIHGQIKRSRLVLPACIMRFFTKDIWHRKDGLLHYSVANLMPNLGAGKQGTAQQLQLKVLLDELEQLTVD